MKQIIRTACIAMATAAIFSSCKKDDKSRTELLTSGNWKIVSDQERVGSGAWEEYIDDYEPCELDNYVKFSKANVVTFNEGASLCDPSDDQEYTLPWSFLSDETQLSVAGEIVDIEELSGSTFIFTSSETVSGTTHYYRQTWKH